MIGRVRPRALIAAGLAVALAAAAVTLWLTGGLKDARTPPNVPPGREIDQVRFHTKLLRAHVENLRKNKFQPAQRILVINAEVTNPTRETVITTGSDDNGFWHSIFLDWDTAKFGPRPKPVDARVIAGDMLARDLPPRVPSSVAVEYQLTATQRVPRHLSVVLAKYERTHSGILDPRGYWQWQARRFETRTETDPLTHRKARVTQIIPVLAARVTLAVRQ